MNFKVAYFGKDLYKSTISPYNFWAPYFNNTDTKNLGILNAFAWTRFLTDETRGRYNLRFDQ